jgi:hypothetical protein
MSEGGFFSRWSRRKLGDEEVRAQESQTGVAPDDAAEVPPPQPSPGGGGSEQAQALPTVEDARALTPESDFRRFVSAGVPPEVKNTALKKLFADPRFNIQDGLDVYIDDYSRPDPIPPEMMRKLASARFLKLFGDEDEGPDAPGREVANDPAAQSVAQSTEAEHAVPPTPHHADPDLRLQQDHAPGPDGPGEGTR